MLANSQINMIVPNDVFPIIRLVANFVMQLSPDVIMKNINTPLIILLNSLGFSELPPVLFFSSIFIYPCTSSGATFLLAQYQSWADYNNRSVVLICNSSRDGRRKNHEYAELDKTAHAIHANRYTILAYSMKVSYVFTSKNEHNASWFTIKSTAKILHFSDMTKCF